MNFGLLFLAVGVIWVASELLLIVFRRASTGSRNRDAGSVVWLNLVIYSSVAVGIGTGDEMTQVRVESFTISLDGYGAGPGQDTDNPLGVGGTDLHHWAFPTRTIQRNLLGADALEVTNYLRHRFGKEKIYLMGHSGGTFIGIHAAVQAPELYFAYIGVAQMSYQLKSERLAYEFMLQQFKENGNTTMVRKLEEAPVTMRDGTPEAYLALRDIAMHNLGIGTRHDMNSVITGIFLPSLTFREYTIGEQVNFWRSKSRSGVSILWDTMLATDLSQTVTELAVPVYFCQGIYDYTCSYTLAKDYFDKLKAPTKGFYTFWESAHSPIFEESEKMRNILLEDVLNGTNSLADTRQSGSSTFSRCRIPYPYRQ